MYEGRVTGEFPAEKIDRMEIGYYMTGSRKEEVGSESVYEEDTENTEEK